MLRTEKCSWANESDACQKYHDQVWGVPTTNETKLFEMLTLEIFQAGLSWKTIIGKKSGFEKAFAGFNCENIARFNQTDYHRLLANQQIIRNRRKILATLHNAKQLVKFHQQGKTLSQLTWLPVKFQPLIHKCQINKPPHFPTLSKRYVALFKQAGFKFVGPTIIYSYLQAVGVCNDHWINCPRYLIIKHLDQKFAEDDRDCI